MSRPANGAWRAPTLAAAFGAAITLFVFWPGLMSVDSAVQFAQARGVVPWDDVHPVLMAALWRATDAVCAGPGGLFALFVLAWWAGLACWAGQWRTTAWRRVMLVLVVGFWPASFLMLGHVWKDVGMSAALLLASAFCLQWHRGRGGWSRVAALVFLFVACGFRHNAAAAALPILIWLLWPKPTQARQWSLRLAGLVVLAGLMAATPGLIAQTAGATQRHAWTVVALWDLAALSITSEQVKLPASVLAGPPLTVAELRQHFDPWANPRLYEVGKIKSSFFHDYSDTQLAEVRAAWWQAVREDPNAYLQHRWRLARHLLFGFEVELPRELIYVPQRIVLPVTPIALAAVDESNFVWRGAAALRCTPLFAGASYLLLAVLAGLLACRRLQGPARAAVGALAASAWANALPLLLISGSAEFRYLTWTVLASVLAAALVLAGERREIG